MTFNRFGADARGATAVEFAMILMPLLLMTQGIIEGGRMMWTRNALQYAVEQATRCAVVNKTTCGTTAQVQSYAASRTYFGMNIAASAFSLSSPSCGAQVSASLPYVPIIPIPMSVTLSATSCRPSG